MPEWTRIARRIRVPLGFAFAVLFLWLARPTWKSIAIGGFVIAPGLLVRALASGHVRKNEALATTGPYAYTRNPLYVGSLLMGIGFAIAARSWWIGLALVVMFFAIYLPVIEGEEKYLGGQFPEFDEYSKNVPRLLPRLIPHSKAGTSSSKFCFDLYRKHREYNALIGVLLMLAALVGKMQLFNR